MSCTLQGSSLLSPVRWCLLSTWIPMIKIRWSHNCVIFTMGIPILERAVLEISLKKLSVQWNELSAQSLKYVTNGGKVITPSHFLWRSSQELNTIWNTEKMVVILKQGPLGPKQYKTDIWHVQSSNKYSPLSWLWLFLILMRYVGDKDVQAALKVIFEIVWCTFVIALSIILEKKQSEDLPKHIQDTKTNMHSAM